MDIIPHPLFIIWTLLHVMGVGTTKIESEFVTCGSVVKIQNVRYSTRLHSHEVKYGSGSGQQSVTGTSTSDDHNSYWVLEGNLTERCRRGEPFECGGNLRMRHSATNCFLHSHHFAAPLSRGNQEVSCFGEEDKSDTGDNWQVICGDGEDDRKWRRTDEVLLRHVDTGVYLGMSGQKYGRPIAGQMEICGLDRKSDTYWKTVEGAFIVPSSNSEL